MLTNFCLLLIYHLIPLWWSENTLMISFSKKFIEVFDSLAYGLPRRMFHMHLKRICVLLLFGGVFCRCQVRLVDNIVQVFCIHADCMSCSLHYWHWNTEGSNYYCYFSISLKTGLLAKNSLCLSGNFNFIFEG